MELENDRSDSYLTAMRNSMTPNTQMVVCVVPSNRKDRYDAIKKFTCVDHPGKLMFVTTCSVYSTNVRVVQKSDIEGQVRILPPSHIISQIFPATPF